MNQNTGVLAVIVMFLFYVFVQSKKIFNYNSRIASSQLFPEKIDIVSSKWKFWLSWVGVSIIGVVTGWHVTTQLTSNIFGYGRAFLVFLSVATYGFVIAMSQWFILRLYIPKSILWVLLNALISGVIVATIWKQGRFYGYDGIAFVIWYLLSFFLGPFLAWQYAKRVS